VRRTALCISSKMEYGAQGSEEIEEEERYNKERNDDETKKSI